MSSLFVQRPQSAGATSISGHGVSVENDVVKLPTGDVSRAATPSAAGPIASEEKYRNLIEHFPTALWQVDSRRTGDVFDQMRANGVHDIMAFFDANPDFVEYAKDVVLVSEVNREAVRLFRADQASDLLKPVRYLFEADPDLAKRVMVAHFNRARNLIEETRMLAFDGAIIDVLFSVTYPRPPEQLDTTFITIQDISERLNIERQLRKLQVDFAHAGRIATLGELATSIAHEINQPLTAIVSNGEASLRWLSRPDHDREKLVQLTSRVVANARRASEIIQRMRGMAAKHELKMHPIDLNATVEETLLFISHDAESNAVALTGTFDPVRPIVMADSVQLQQVVINLLLNSVQALAQGGSAHGRIEVRTELAGGRFARICIADNGPGIAASDLNRVFDSFYSTKEAGLGVGLAICQTIVNAHGGELSVTNRLEGGAQFAFSIPLATTMVSLAL